MESSPGGLEAALTGAMLRGEVMNPGGGGGSKLQRHRERLAHKHGLRASTDEVRSTPGRSENSSHE